MNQMQPIPIADRAALNKALAEIAFSDPPIIDAMRLVGFSYAEVARLVGCRPEQLNSWVKGRRRIPPIKHLGMIMFVFSLAYWLEPQPGPYGARAKVLAETLIELGHIAHDEAFPGDDPIPEGVTAAALALANEMLRKIGCETLE